VGTGEYGEATLTEAWWSGLFGVEVRSGVPERIGSGQVGMNLRVRLESVDPTVPATVVVKLASPDPVSRATGMSLRNYEREVKFYREIAATVDVRVPHCHFADWNPDGGDIMLVLEDMAPAEQGDQIRGCGPDEAVAAVEELARLHGPRWGDPTLHEVDWLQRRAAAGDAEQLAGLYSMLLPGFLATLGGAVDAGTDGRGTAFLEELARRIPAYVAGLGEPWTVTHGDYRLDNLLFCREPGSPPCTVVDWQTPGHGNGAVDLAYFIGAGLLPPERREMEWDLVARWRAGVEAHGHVLDPDAVDRAIRLLGAYARAIVGDGFSTLDLLASAARRGGAA
jgi:aminoglycoside/choline kinase family phosphotransferase